LEGTLEIIESNSPAKAGSLQKAAQESIPLGFEYLQRRRLLNLFHCSSHPQIKDVFL